jgi:nucleoside-diphosphate-sugar epimerase
MSTLVTGGNGFIGSNVVKTLAERGHSVVSFDLVAPDELVKRYLDPWKDQIEYFQGDILDKKDLDKLAQLGINKIVHAAVFTGVLPKIENSQASSIIDINVLGTTNLLEFARKISPNRFLYVSSGAVYGTERPTEEILSEESEVKPNNLYSITKYASELLTKRYGELCGFENVSVRLNGPYGPMEKITGHRENQSLIKTWIEQALRGEPIEIDNRSLVHEATYVTDIAEGIVAVLDSPSLSYAVYNNASGRQSTLGGIIEILEELCPGVEIRDVPYSKALDSIPKGRENSIDINRLKEDVGFTPKISLAQGLEAYLEWYRHYKS